MEKITKGSPKTILVTGAAGLIGTHLCERLLTSGHKVVGMDNYFTGMRRNADHLLNYSNFSICQHDIVHPISFNEQFDEIFNLACPASPKHFRFDPVYTMKTSIYGAINMLELARQSNAKTLQASYGGHYDSEVTDPLDDTWHDSAHTAELDTCYLDGKRSAETLFFAFHHTYRLPIKIARIFNTYGPKMNPLDGRLISSLVCKALKGEPIIIDGDVSRTQTFCFVHDLVDGLIKLMDSSDDVVGPVDLGNVEECKIGDLVDWIIAATGSSSRVVYVQPSELREDRRKPDISFAKERLNWSPRMPIRIGLAETIDHFDQLLVRDRPMPAAKDADLVPFEKIVA